MRTFVGVIAGFCVTGLLMLAGEWGYMMVVSPTLYVDNTAFEIVVALLSLLYIGIAVIAGVYLSVIIDDSPQTIAGYSVLQLFFGVWFFREFWTTGFAWYKPTALFLVIPCAMLARSLARRSGRGLILGAPTG